MPTMKSSQGTTVRVSEDKAQRLRKSGFTDVAESTKPAPKKRGRPKKTENESLESMIWDDEAGG